MKVGELLVRLGADLSQLDKDLNEAQKRARTAGTTIGDIFRNAFSFTLGIGFFEVVRRGFQGVVGEAVNFNAMMEQARIGFTTMLGGAERAQAFLDEMADFAARTPFEYPDLLDAAKRMLAYGFAAEDVLPTLKAVGDATAGLGLGREGINRILLALGQMRAKAKVSGEEMRQLTEAGVPAWEMLAEAMGVSTAEVMKLSERGLIPADKAIRILTEGMEKRFPNMMENMQNTWQGVTSTIKDVWRMTIGALTSSLFRGVVQWLQKVRDFATEFHNTFRQFGLQAALTKSFGPEFTATVNMAVSALRGFWNVAKATLGAVARYWAVIKPIALGALAAFLSFRLVNWVFGLAAKAVVQFTFVTAVMRGEAVATSGILNFVARAVQIYQLQMHLASMAGITHIGILQVLRTALYSVWAALGPLGWAVLGVSAAVTAGIIAWSKYAASVERANLASVMAKINQQTGQYSGSAQTAAEGAEGLADATEKAGDATEKAGKAAGKNIQSFDEVHQIMEETASAAKDSAGGLGEVTTPTLEVPEVGGIGGLPELDMSALEQAKPTWAGFWQWMKDNALNAWGGIKNGLLNAWNWIVAQTEPVWRPVANFFSALWDGIKGVAVTAWQQIGNVLATTWQAMVNIGIGVWQVLAATVVQIWNSLQVAAQTVFGAIYNFVVGTWSNFYTAISAIWNAVWAFLTTLWNNIWVTAGTIWQAIADLITGKIDLRTAIATIWGAIVAFFSATWTSIQTAAITIWSAISQFLTNEWQLIETTAITIWSAIAQFLSDTWNAISNAASQIWTIIAANLQSIWESIKTAAVTIWESIKTAIENITNATKALLEAIWIGISAFLGNIWNTISSVANTVWSSIKNFFESVLSAISLTFNTTWNAISSFLSTVWGSIQATAKTIWTAIKTFFSTTLTEIQSSFSTIWNAIKAFLETIWNNIKTTADNVWNSIKALFENLLLGIQEKFSGIWTAIKTFLETTWNGLAGAASNIWSAIRDTLSGLAQETHERLTATWESIKNALFGTWQGIKATAEDVWEGVYTIIKNTINSIIGAINKFIRGFNRLEIHVPEITIPFVGTFGGWTINPPSIPEIPYLAEGGIVTSPTLAVLGEKGPEAVVPLSRGGFADDMASTVAQAVYAAVRDAFRVIYAEQGATHREIVLEVDGKRIARALIPSLISEGQRTGLPVVLRSV